MSDQPTNPWTDEAAAPRGPAKPTAAPRRTPPQPQASPVEYDIEGLMTDFPTARELERFVFDETGTVLNLKGRANRLKYQVAMDVLNGQPVDEKYIGRDNPYLERADLVPEEPLRVLPERDPALPDRSQLQNEFYSPFVPHSDAEYRAQGRRMHCTFRKYRNGVITYEVLGPIEPRPEGMKIDKFGRERPEIIRWVDPRTGEQLIQREDGTLTPIGRRLRAMLQTFKYNNSNQWVQYVDREFISLDQRASQNPWDIQDA